MRRNRPTDGEIEREMELCRKLTRLDLIPLIVHDRKTDRRYFFAENGYAGFGIDHRPDVSALMFGDLNTEDSEGYECRTPPEMAIPLEYMPLVLTRWPLPRRLPAMGTKYGACERCRHAECAAARKIARAKCNYCGKAIGFEVQYYDLWDESGKVGGYAHRECIGAELDEEEARLRALKPHWEGTHKDRELPKPKTERAA